MTGTEDGPIALTIRGPIALTIRGLIALTIMVGSLVRSSVCIASCGCSVNPDRRIHDAR